jgi:hypothetical protein
MARTFKTTSSNYKLCYFKLKKGTEGLVPPNSTTIQTFLPFNWQLKVVKVEHPEQKIYRRMTAAPATMTVRPKLAALATPAAALDEEAAAAPVPEAAPDSVPVAVVEAPDMAADSVPEAAAEAEPAALVAAAAAELAAAETEAAAEEAAALMEEPAALITEEMAAPAPASAAVVVDWAETAAARRATRVRYFILDNVGGIETKKKRFEN